MSGIVAVSEASLEKRRLSEEMYQRWVSFVDASPRTIETYRKNMKQFFLYLRENGIDQPTRDDVVSYREYLKLDHKPTTVQGYMAAVKLFFQWTAQEGIYPNVADHVKGAKIDSGHKKDYLTSKQAGAVLESVDRLSLKGKRDYAILSLMMTTGLRTISVVSADVGDIRVVGDSMVLYYKGKGHDEKSVYVKLAYPVEEAIREYLKARGSARADEPLFTSDANRNNGERMTTRSISRIAKTQMIGAGFDSDRLTAHSLRHTAATLNLLSGGTVEETQQLLGHSNINTTYIYVHALERVNNNSENRIANAIFGA